jgi:phosphatidyl-myo-inositol alpha-mannosyltransferase
MGSSVAEKPLRIAMISYYLPSGSKIGVGYQVDALASELVRRGHTVDVFSECPPVEGAAYGHRRINLCGPMRTFRFARQLRRVAFDSYDVLHAHGDDYWMWRRQVPVHVRTLHGSCLEAAMRIKGVKEKFRMVLLGFSEVIASIVAAATVVISPSTLRWTPWVHNVIPNGVETTRFHPARDERAVHPVILFVGAWGARKRLGDRAGQRLSPQALQCGGIRCVTTPDAHSSRDHQLVVLGHARSRPAVARRGGCTGERN